MLMQMMEAAEHRLEGDEKEWRFARAVAILLFGAFGLCVAMAVAGFALRHFDKTIASSVRPRAVTEILAPSPDTIGGLFTNTFWIELNVMFAIQLLMPWLWLFAGGFVLAAPRFGKPVAAAFGCSLIVWAFCLWVNLSMAMDTTHWGA
jgi:hypothetical protein